ncbi:PREDICTED: thyrotropin-releasing hormone receptor-like [Branchiostoma belcheri]|uniref:Thyrotropin-releasing hormone receptor n=1 Tax=Branchiostoma belcheri TaxID=7741 RepID=A0A6P4YLZ3_BRABE|nr:PREDICTED: thyrotropin-releasing hormone receptor-like [Branchiostoma belcheri]
METTVNTTELVEYITDSLYARTTNDNLTLTQTMMPDMNGNTTDVPPTNTSFPDPPTFPMSYQVITTVLVLVICSIGIVGNIMVVLVVTRIKSMRSPTNCYLVSLAVADLIVLVTAGIPNIPDSFYYESAWMYGHSGCLIITYLQYLGINTSSMSILAFTVERYIAICHPLYAQTMCTVSRAKKIIAGVWVLTLAYDSMWFFLMGTETIVYGNGAEVLQCGYNLERSRYLTVYFLDLSLFYLLPLIVAAVLYVRIGRVLYSEDIAEAGNIEIANKGQTHVKHMQARRINSRKQVVKMLACVVVLFAVLWMPYRVLVVCNSFIDPPNYDKWVVLFCRLPIYINSACNPVLYNAMSVKFRRAFSKLAKCTSKRDDLNSMNFQSSIRAVTRSNRV